MTTIMVAAFPILLTCLALLIWQITEDGEDDIEAALEMLPWTVLALSLFCAVHTKL